MTLRKCVHCKEEKQIINFISIKNEMLGGVYPICRQCIRGIIEATDDSNRWNTVNKLCQLGDIPFVPEEFEKMYQANGSDTFGQYVFLFKGKEFETVNWKEYNEAYVQLEQCNRLDMAIGDIREQKQEQLRKKWGPDYSDKELEILENLYDGTTQTISINNKLIESDAIKLCKLSLIIDQKIQLGKDIDKDLKSYDLMAKRLGITTETLKEGNEFNSVGELYSYFEKVGTKFKYYHGAIRDEVDKSMKDIKYWLRYLYINETGVAEDIAERINNLKTADKENNNEFDWGGYEKFSETIDETEDFKIDY